MAPTTHSSAPALSPWYTAAALLGGLFLMSGADGQQRVQLIFLVLAAGCVALGHWQPVWQDALQRWLDAHPAARSVVYGGTAFWRS